MRTLEKTGLMRDEKLEYNKAEIIIRNTKKDSYVVFIDGYVWSRHDTSLSAYVEAAAYAYSDGFINWRTKNV